MTGRRTLAILNVLMALIAIVLGLSCLWLYLYGAGPAFAVFAGFFIASAVLNAVGCAYFWKGNDR